jgi:hypothetical protein
MSIYGGGFQIDKNDYIHLTLGLDDTYGTTNYSGTLYYMYSPPSFDAAIGINRPGLYWYAANGSTVAINTINTVSPMRYTSSTANAAIIATAFSNTLKYHNKNYAIGAGEAMSLHQSDTFNNGLHILPRPYCTFYEWNYYTFEPPKPWLAYYNPSASSANVYGWVQVNLATAILANGYAASARAYKGRHYGSMAIDRQNTIYVYGANKRSLNYASAQWAGEIQEWSSRDGGHKWNWRLITDRSSVSVPLISIKKELSNNLIELAYTRGKKTMYYAEDLQEGKFRDNGNDVTVIYTGGASTNQQLDCVADYWNYSSSKVDFKSHTTIPTGWIYDTAGAHYIYYGKYAAAPALSNPKNIYSVYENFEHFNDDESIFNRPGWSLYPGLSSVTAGDVKAMWSIDDPTDSRLYGRKHTNKIWSGDKSCAFMTPTVGVFATCYAYTALPTDVRNNCVGEISMWQEGNYYGLVGVTYGDTHTVLGVRVGVDTWSYFNGNSWIDSPVKGLFAPVYSTYRRITFSMINGKISFYADAASTPLPLAPITVPTGQLSRIIFGISNPDGIRAGSAINFYDYIKVYKVSPQE